MSAAVTNGAAPTVVLAPVNLAPMDFGDLQPIEVPVTAPGGDRYVLREAGAGACTAYENAQARALKFDDGKMTGLEGIYDADLLVLGLCLHPVDKTSGRVLRDQTTSVETIKAWSARVYKPLVERLKEISPNLERKETEDTLVKQIANLQKKLDDLRKTKGQEDLATKNSPGATAGTSA